jgi:hypothetical protein
MRILMESQVVVQKSEQMQVVSLSGLAGASADEWPGWPRFAQLMSEGRHVELRMGPKEDHRKFGEVAGVYATEIVFKGEEENQRGVFGTPIHIIETKIQRYLQRTRCDD